MRTTVNASPSNPARTFLPFALALLLGALLSPATLFAAQDRGIQVNGEAELRVAPDMAMLHMEILEEHTKAAVARAEVDKISSAALQIIREAGVAGEDTDTTGLSITPRYRWNKSEERQEITGYRVARSIEVCLLDLDKLGALLTKLSDAGVNQINSPQPGLQDRETVYLKVLAAAAENARSRARTIADALGQKLGPVVTLSAHSSPIPQPMRREMAMRSADAVSSPAAESYQSGHITFRVSVSAQFALL